MKFSIITPVLNNLIDLPKCIGSIRGQQITACEHIIQDGSSTDGTVEYLQAQNDIIHQSEPDTGMYDAIQKGWNKADGDILSWLNADEQYLPGTLNLVKETFHNNPDVNVVFGNTILVDKSGKAISARREIPLRKTYVVNGFLYALSCTMFFRRKLWDDNMLKFDISLKMAADMNMVLSLMDKNCTFLHIPSYFSLFGVAKSNLSASSQMQEESERVRVRHNAFKGNIARKLILSSVGLAFLVAIVGVIAVKYNTEIVMDVDQILLSNSREAKATSEITDKIQRINSNLGKLFSNDDIN